MVERNWDDTNWSVGDTLTATELSNHAAEGHAEGEIYWEIDNGVPVIKDTTSDTIILRWDRSNARWKLENAGFDFNGNPLSGVGSLDVEQTRTKSINGDGIHFAADFDGVDADERLDNALAGLDDGILFLEMGAEYVDDRTIGPCPLIKGGRYSGTDIEGVWTLSDNESMLENVILRSGGSIVVTANQARLSYIYDLGNGISVSGDNCVITHGSYIDVTFESGTSGGIAIANTNLSATDNGSNQIPSGSNS